jgi:tetratricopeptide (TPR) repeat protein
MQKGQVVGRCCIMVFQTADHPSSALSVQEIVQYLYQMASSVQLKIEPDRELGHFLHKNITLLPDNDQDKPTLLQLLGDMSLLYYNTFHNIEDLDNATSVLGDAVLLTPNDHPARPTRLKDLGLSFLKRFERLGDLGAIENSISTFEDAVRLTPDDHQDKPIYLCNLGSSFLHRFIRLGDRADIEKAILKHQDAVRLTPDSHLTKPSYLSNLGSSFSCRFEHFGDLVDLDNSILMFEDAMRLTPDGDSNIHKYMHNLATSLCDRFEHSSNIADIDKSIHFNEAAVGLVPNGDPLKPDYLSALGRGFSVRFERLRDLIDMNKSITASEDAVRLTPDDHPTRCGYLNGLSGSLRNRFKHLGNLADLNQAILASEDAIQLTPDGHPRKPGYLSNLGSLLDYRFAVVGDINDINSAISLQDKARQLTSDDHPEMPSRLNNLGISIARRFDHLRDPTDNDKSISMFEDVIRLTPDGYPGRPGYMNNLGASFVRRYEHLGDHLALDQAILYYSRAAHSAFGTPHIRFKAASEWIRCAQLLQHSSLLQAYDLALDLLPKLAWLGLPIPDRHREIIDAGNVTSDAAATAIRFGKYDTAIEWLEQGRSIVWGQLLKLRTPFDELRERYPRLAARLAQVSSELEGGSIQDHWAEVTNQMPLEQTAHGRRRLASEWEEIVKEVRELPGFEGFLLSKKLSQLVTAARSGPVVMLNVCSTRSDALILMPDLDDVIHIPLPGFTFEKAQGLRRSLSNLLLYEGRCITHGRHMKLVHTDDGLWNTDTEFESILSELWLHVVKPVLDILAFRVCFLNILLVFWI